MAKKWYVVHVFSGSEKKVCQNIEEQIITKDINYSRVYLINSVQKVLKNGLGLLNVSAPTKM